MPTKRGIILADLHTGHVAGITPPEWQDASGSLAAKTAPLRAEVWQWYISRLKAFRPFHFCIVNGDAIDGRGERAGGTEIILPDRLDQVRAAAAVIRAVRAKNNILIRGTPYHTGSEEDLENLIAAETDAVIGDHLWPEVNGVIFDCKHKIGGSQVPHGRHTAIARDKLWNGIWAEHQEQPRAQILIRSHVHYHAYAGAADWLGITTPALQAACTKYGARQCSGHVDLGLLVVDINHHGEYSWHAELLKPKHTKAHTLKI